MNKKDFMKALSMIDDELLRDADAPANTAETEYAESVSGVEQYHRPVWKRIATLAAALVFVVGVGAGGTYYLTHRGAPAPEEERIIAASTAETETTSAETDKQAEVTTVPTRKRDTLAKTTIKGETRESTDTQPVSDPSEDGEEREPISDTPVTTATPTSPAPQTTVTTGKIVADSTAVQTTAIPVWTQFPQTTRIDPNWYPGIDPYDQDYDIFAQLANNSYSPYTCDGIPEYRLVAPDGTEYLINLTDKWAWRRTPDMIGQPIEPEETKLTFSEWYYLEIRGADIGMREDIYGW
ncbi:hypothetical protein SAMN02910353_00367 [Ruminococcus sp. YRD2003]|uniref:hypothetical protein n=1 Tax=Ruminococcus sp. YRD2003 TaxID=1452313 RepID=UPI0008CEC5B8|nr:hypothetical protein SAMN02910353_00367 [Ruminococcus flavefaciens]